jgi:hypothetical protein
MSDVKFAPMPAILSSEIDVPCPPIRILLGEEVTRLNEELDALKARAAYTEECLRDILELVDTDPEASDPTTALYVAIKRAEIALDPSTGRELLGLPPAPSLPIGTGDGHE